MAEHLDESGLDIRSSELARQLHGSDTLRDPTRDREADASSESTLPPFAAWNAGIPSCVIGGVRIACLDRMQTVAVMLDIISGRCGVRREAVYMTSANGQVMSEIARSARLRDLFEAADLISADGQPMVLWSKLFGSRPVPERCATTDLYHDVSRRAPPGTTYFLLGSTPDEVARAVSSTRRHYPHIEVIGFSDGYFAPEEEDELVRRIRDAAPDILWVSMGVPREQAFAVRNRHRLSGVGIIKTSGGLFNFLSGTRPRAPYIMQVLGMEWLYRLALEPRRLFWRYLFTNCHSILLLLTRTR